MGTWGELAFDNDMANDWAYGLDDVDDLSLVEAAFDEVQDSEEDGFLDSSTAEAALAACEVLARLKGNFGYKNSYTEKVDEWVAKHKLNPSPKLLNRAADAIDRVIGDDSELHGMWKESRVGPTKWLAAVADLRRRLLV